jgi:hypothetical protein
METANRAPLRERLKNPTFRVIGTWIWWLAGAALAALAIAVITGNRLSNTATILEAERHLVVYVEIVSVGLLPVLFTWICHDELRCYGLQRPGLLSSLLLSLAFVAVMYGIGYLMNGQIMSESGRCWPGPW